MIYYYTSFNAKQLRDKEEFNKWRKAHGKAWAEQLRSIIIERLNIGHKWQFNEEPNKLLQQYYKANELLADCVNSTCCLSSEARTHIEETLLLPIAEIEKRKPRG